MVPGWLQILLVVVLAVLLFGGRGKISELMGDFAKGINSFKKGIKDEPDETAEADAKTIDHSAEERVAETAETRKAG
jgi:sec-independent protein translocase protein TatA